MQKLHITEMMFNENFFNNTNLSDFYFGMFNAHELSDFCEMMMEKLH